MQLIKNKKGQAILESVIVLNLVLMLFFFMILISTYIYDRMIVFYATSVAMEVAIGRMPEPGITRGKLETAMKESAYGILGFGVFLANPVVDPRISRSTGKIYCKVSAQYAIQLPLISNLLNNNMISHASEIDYYWKP